MRSLSRIFFGPIIKIKMLPIKRTSLSAILKRVFNIKKTVPRIRVLIDFFPACGLNPEKWYLLLKVRTYSQLSSKRLSNLYELTKEIEKKKIRGAFVECGVRMGGSCAIMVSISRKVKSQRKIWLFDSFEGMPEPQEIDGKIVSKWSGGVSTGRLTPTGWNVASIEKVKKLFFENFNFDQEDILIKKGWLQHTLPVSKLEVGEIAILHLDVDLYESTKVCLDYLYDNVVQGGYIIVDDYNFFVGCKIAVDTFLEKRNLKIKLSEIDAYGVYFKKP